MGRETLRPCILAQQDTTLARQCPLSNPTTRGLPLQRSTWPHVTAAGRVAEPPRRPSGALTALSLLQPMIRRLARRGAGRKHTGSHRFVQSGPWVPGRGLLTLRSTLSLESGSLCLSLAGRGGGGGDDSARVVEQSPTRLRRDVQALRGAARRMNRRCRGGRSLG